MEMDPAPATALPDELTEEIFLRCHPADAASLVRAALTCKRWRRLIADPGFRRRFRAFHRVPHMLGFFSNQGGGATAIFYGTLSTFARFVPTSTSLKHAGLCASRAIDARHGRVLLQRAGPDQNNDFAVWDPITGVMHPLPRVPVPCCPRSWNAAVFCSVAAAGCDHLDCHGKPFAVVFVGTNHDKDMFFDVSYSSKTGRWSWVNHACAQPPDELVALEPTALVRNALYFVLEKKIRVRSVVVEKKTRILRYDIRTREMRIIDLPPSASFSLRRIVLFAVEYGGLGFATVCDSNLCIWLRNGGSVKDAGWVRKRVIDLKALLPDDSFETSPDVVGFADGIGIVFICTLYGYFRIDINSLRVKKVRNINGGFTIFPYMSFHTPALGSAASSTGEGPNMRASSASEA